MKHLLRSGFLAACFLLPSCGQTERCPNGICLECSGDDCETHDPEVPVCPAPALLTCADACRDPLVDRDNCGACGVSCAAGDFCVEGSCKDECGGRAPNACDGLCVDLRQHPDHCGSCDTACAAVQFCVNGSCEGSCGTLLPTSCGQDVRGTRDRSSQLWRLRQCLPRRRTLQLWRMPNDLSRHDI